MQRIKLYSFIVISILCCQPLFGQQVYQLRHYGKPGDIYLYNRLTGAQNTEVLQSGTDVTWDLSSNTNLNTHVSEIVTPGEGINQFTFLAICTLGGISPFDCFTIWNNTDQALLIPDTLSLFQFSLTNLQRYQNKTSTRLLENFFGFTVDLGGTVTQAVIVYQSPDTIINFPVLYGNQWTSQITWTLDLSATGQNIAYSSSQDRTTSIDSWGTLITPYDTFENVIGLRSEILRQDTLITDSISIPLSLTQVEYMWFDTNYTLPVMTANGVATDSTDIISAVQYIYEATCATPTWTADSDQDVYYIDTSGTVTVNFVITNSNANEYSWDFGDSTFGTSTGSVSHSYDSAGTYAVAVSGCMTNCLPLNSCSFAIIDFEIRDTTTSVPVIPGDEIGINLYPNPVTESLTLEIPNQLGIQQYRVFDIAGRQVDRGILNTGHSVIPSDDLESGVYTIQLWNKEGNRNQLAIMRFMVMSK